MNWKWSLRTNATTNTYSQNNFLYSMQLKLYHNTKLAVYFFCETIFMCTCTGLSRKILNRSSNSRDWMTHSCNIRKKMFSYPNWHQSLLQRCQYFFIFVLVFFISSLAFLFYFDWWNKSWLFFHYNIASGSLIYQVCHL